MDGDELETEREAGYFSLFLVVLSSLYIVSNLYF